MGTGLRRFTTPLNQSGAHMVATIFKDNLFHDKVAIVTGGGSGIGLRTARELAQLGATVVLGGRTLEKLQAAAQRITTEGGRAHAVVCDIREEDSVQHFVRQAIELAGTIDLLVNNAGGQFLSRAEKISANGWDTVVKTNLNGSFYMCREVYNQVFHKRGGAIVNVIGNVANGFPRAAHSAAARAGVDAMAKTMAAEWARHGVRLNCVAPGPIDSGGFDAYPEHRKAAALAAGRFCVANRLGTSAEVAAAIIFLLSPAAAYITGSTLLVEGGESVFNPMYPNGETIHLPAYAD